MPRWFLTAYQEINNMHMVSTAIVTMVGGIENYYLQGLVIKIDRSKSLTHGFGLVYIFTLVLIACMLAELIMTIASSG